MKNLIPYLPVEVLLPFMLLLQSSFTSLPLRRSFSYKSLYLGLDRSSMITFKLKRIQKIYMPAITHAIPFEDEDRSSNLVMGPIFHVLV